MAFDPKQYLADKEAERKGKVIPKDPSVEGEFGGAKQYLRNIAMSAPDPVPISSAWRDEAANVSAGGVSNSFHKTGDALDIRKIGDQSKNLDHFRSQGFQVIDEGDHFHLEPGNSVKKEFDPKSYLDEIELQEDLEIPEPETSVSPEELGPEDTTYKNVNSFPEWSFLRNFTRGATAGLSEPIASGIAAPIAQQIIKRDPNLAALPDEKKQLKNIYKSIRASSKTELQRQKEADPWASGLGEVAGIVAPGGAFNRIYGAAEKGIAKAAPILSKIPEKFAARAMTEGALRGGLTNMAYRGIDPGSESAPLENFAWGSSEALMAPVSRGLKSLKSGAAKEILPERIRNLVERTPGIGRFFEKGRQFNEAVAKRGGTETLQGLPKADAISAADDFGKAIGESRKAMGESYQKTVRPVLKKYGLKKASPDNLRQTITGIFDEQGLLDPKGNILFDQIDEIVAPERKRFVKTLSDISESLKKNPSIQNLNKKIQDLGSLANFGSPNRTAEEKLFAKMYDTARDDLFSSLEKAVGESAKMTKGYKALKKQFGRAVDQNAAYNTQIADDLTGERLRRVLKEGKQANLGKISEIESGIAALDDQAMRTGQETVAAVRDARRMYSENKPILDELSKIVDTKWSDDVVKSAQTRFPSEFVGEIIKKQPQLKAPMSQVLMNNIVQSGTTAKTLTKAIDRFGRDNLKQVLDPTTFNKLLEAEQAFHVSERIAPIYKFLGKIIQGRSGGSGKQIGPVIQTMKSYAQ